MGFEEGVRSAGRVGSNDGWGDEVDRQGRFLFERPAIKETEKKVASVLLYTGEEGTRERERKERGEYVRRTRRVRSPVLLRRG